MIENIRGMLIYGVLGDAMSRGKKIILNVP